MQSLVDRKANIKAELSAYISAVLRSRLFDATFFFNFKKHSNTYRNASVCIHSLVSLNDEQVCG